MPSDHGYRVVNIRQFNRRWRFDARLSNGRSDTRVAELVVYGWEKNKSFEIIFAYNLARCFWRKHASCGGPTIKARILIYDFLMN